MKYKVIGWTYYEDYSVPEAPNTFASQHALIDEIRARGYLFSGFEHQEASYGVPVFNDGKRRLYSQRGFGGVMAEAHGYNGAYDYSGFAYSVEREALVAPKFGYDRKEFKSAAELRETFVLDLTDEQKKTVAEEYEIVIDDLPELRYIDSGDFVKIPFGKKTRTYRVRSVDRKKDLTNEERADLLSAATVEERARKDEKIAATKTLLKIIVRPYRTTEKEWSGRRDER